jgi:hypothetical protein
MSFFRALLWSNLEWRIHFESTWNVGFLGEEVHPGPPPRTNDFFMLAIDSANTPIGTQQELFNKRQRGDHGDNAQPIRSPSLT